MSSIVVLASINLSWFYCQVEGVIHFEDDTEELQQWDQQVI